MRLFSWVSVGRYGPHVGIGLSRRIGRRSGSPAVERATDLILTGCFLLAILLVVLLWGR